MPKRKFSREFKVSAVKLVNEQGYTIVDAAKSLGIDPSNFRSGWASLLARRGWLPWSGGVGRRSYSVCVRRTPGY